MYLLCSSDEGNTQFQVYTWATLSMHPFRIQMNEYIFIDCNIEDSLTLVN